MNTSRNLYPTVNRYLYNNFIEKTLPKRCLNIEDEIYLMSAEELKQVMNLDEYFYRLMKEREPNRLNTPLNRYLNEISRELYNHPLLLLDLPMFQLDKNILRQYLPNYDYIIGKIKEKENEVNTIYRRFITSPNSITYQELQKLTNFLSYSIPYSDTKMFKAQEQVAKYLLNKQKDTPYNYTFTMFLIKFFGYKKIREDKMFDTRIIIGKLPSTTYGESTDNYAIVNKELLQRVTMESNTLEDKFGKQIKRENISQRTHLSNKTELLAILHTLYHEIRHQKQKVHSEASNIDDLSYYYAAYEIINQNNEFDYKTNYKFYEIEKDANYYAWEDIEKLIKTYMPNHNLDRTMKNILSHKLKEELELITGIRKTENNQTYISSSLLVKTLDDKMKNNPYMLNNKYKQLLTFYNKDGSPKRENELLKLPLVYEYRDFYFTQVNYRSKFPITQLNRRDIQSSTQRELQIIINNIKILMITTREKINKIRDRIDKYSDTGKEVNINLQNYYNFSVYLSNIMNEILLLYPTITNDLAIRNSITSINSNIEMINNNSLISRNISSSSKISKVGRR